MAEAVEAQAARVETRGHDHPGGDGDGRVRTAEAAVKPALHEALEDGELVAAVEDDLGRRAVEPDDKDLPVIH